QVRRKAEAFFICAVPLGHRRIGWLPVGCHASRTSDRFDHPKRRSPCGSPEQGVLGRIICLLGRSKQKERSTYTRLASDDRRNQVALSAWRPRSLEDQP